MLMYLLIAKYVTNDKCDERNMGIKRNFLYRWRDQLSAKGENTFQGSGRPKLEEISEVNLLRKELKDVKEERFSYLLSTGCLRSQISPKLF
ncbi:MAG: hypothetical protein Q8Q33_06590 [Chlamydiota bacterium]|nr:hypothetical protein [Chlamydiota bacterium]